eukprot:scaffold3542_cov113-Isochrysis_galbana.AAC.9
MFQPHAPVVPRLDAQPGCRGGRRQRRRRPASSPAVWPPPLPGARAPIAAPDAEHFAASTPREVFVRLQNNPPLKLKVAAALTRGATVLCSGRGCGPQAPPEAGSRSSHPTWARISSGTPTRRSPSRTTCATCQTREGPVKAKHRRTSEKLGLARALAARCALAAVEELVADDVNPEALGRMSRLGLREGREELVQLLGDVLAVDAVNVHVAERDRSPDKQALVDRR